MVTKNFPHLSPGKFHVKTSQLSSVTKVIRPLPTWTITLENERSKGIKTYDRSRLPTSHILDGIIYHL
jgi:hypothetical protein